MTIEEALAKIEDLDGQLAKVKANNDTLKTQLKSRPTLESIQALAAGKPPADDDRLSGAAVEQVLALRESASQAEKDAEEARKKAAAAEKEAAKFRELHTGLQAQMDRSTMTEMIRKTGGDRLNDDMLDLLVDHVAPFLGKGEDGKFSPMRDGRPWTDETGNAVTLERILDDMSPSGDGKLTGAKRTGFFVPQQGGLPGDPGGGGGTPQQPAAGGLDAARAALAGIMGS